MNAIQKRPIVEKTELQEMLLNSSSEPDFSDADLRYANFSEEKVLCSNNFTRARLSRSNFCDVKLYSVIFNHAELTGAYFIRARIDSADFSKADLYDCNFADSFLCKVNFVNADLRGANFSRVFALDCDFSGANLTGACIENFHPNDKTKLDNIICDFVFGKGDCGFYEKHLLDGKSNPDNFAEFIRHISNSKIESSEEVQMQGTEKQQQKILILSAIPHGLRLDKEIREIDEAIRRATRRDLFEICIKTAVRPQDIRRAIAEEQPQIVHFCGHGLEDGCLLLEDNGENDKFVTPEGLASLFKLHTEYVKCVLLNVCYSEIPADAISKHIDYVIGMNNSVEDSAAIEFAKGFYDGLGYNTFNNQNVFQRAFDEGVVAAQMENISQGQIPKLKKKL